MTVDDDHLDVAFWLSTLEIHNVLKCDAGGGAGDEDAKHDSGWC